MKNVLWFSHSTHSPKLWVKSFVGEHKFLAHLQTETENRVGSKLESIQDWWCKSNETQCPGAFECCDCLTDCERRCWCCGTTWWTCWWALFDDVHNWSTSLWRKARVGGQREASQSSSAGLLFGALKAKLWSLIQQIVFFWGLCWWKRFWRKNSYQRNATGRKQGDCKQEWSEGRIMIVLLKKQSEEKLWNHLIVKQWRKSMERHWLKSIWMKKNNKNDQLDSKSNSTLDFVSLESSYCCDFVRQNCMTERSWASEEIVRCDYWESNWKPVWPRCGIEAVKWRESAVEQCDQISYVIHCCSWRCVELKLPHIGWKCVSTLNVAGEVHVGWKFQFQWNWAHQISMWLFAGSDQIKGKGLNLMTIWQKDLERVKKSPSVIIERAI